MTDKEIAEMLCELFGDTACNFNDNYEWLSYVCKYRDTICPYISGVDCWLQFIKYYKNREKIKEGVELGLYDK